MIFRTSHCIIFLSWQNEQQPGPILSHPDGGYRTTLDGSLRRWQEVTSPPEGLILEPCSLNTQVTHSGPTEELFPEWSPLSLRLSLWSRMFRDTLLMWQKRKWTPRALKRLAREIWICHPQNQAWLPGKPLIPKSPRSYLEENPGPLPTWRR